MKFLKIGVIMVLSALLMIPTQIPVDNSKSDDMDISVYTGDTENLGGGNYVEIQYKNIRAGVIYGTPANPNGIVIYSTGKNTLREIEEYDGDRLVKKEVESADTLFYMNISRIIEYNDANNNSKFDALIDGNGNYTLKSIDYPLGGIEIQSISGGRPSIIRKSNEIEMKISLKLRDPDKNLNWNDIKGRMERVNGVKMADSISMEIKIKMNLEDADMEIPVNGGKDMSTLENGHIVDISAKAYLNITGWKFQNPDSKLFVESREGFLSADSYNDMCANMSTPPRPIDIKGSTQISTPRPIYGHEIKFKLSDKIIGSLRGNPYVVVDGENRTYTMRLCGLSPENESFGNSSYTGFLLETTNSLQKNYSKNMENASLSGDIHFKYAFIDKFPFTDATPKWSYIMPFEIAIATGVILIYARKSHSD